VATARSHSPKRMTPVDARSGPQSCRSQRPQQKIKRGKAHVSKLHPPWSSNVSPVLLILELSRPEWKANEMVANRNGHGNCHTQRQSYHRTDAESGAGDAETPWKRHEKAVQMLSINPPWCHRHHKPHVYLNLSAKGENKKSDMTCPMAFACATKKRNHSSPGSVHRSKMRGWMKLCPSRFEIEPQP
jgi:hypothetical protein